MPEKKLRDRKEGKNLEDMTNAEKRRRKHMPDTLMWCNHCNRYVLRSRWPKHEEHDMEALGIERYVDEYDRFKGPEE